MQLPLPCLSLLLFSALCLKIAWSTVHTPPSKNCRGTRTPSPKVTPTCIVVTEAATVQQRSVSILLSVCTSVCMFICPLRNHCLGFTVLCSCSTTVTKRPHIIMSCLFASRQIRPIYRVRQKVDP